MGLLEIMMLPVGIVLRVVEKVLFVMITMYDAYCYAPLQKSLSPLVAKVPRNIELGGRQYPVFTANIVSWCRTILVIPIACCLKYDYNVAAFVCVLIHDFLDHLDGIVAKVQKVVYGPVDDPLLGGFMDAFCDKIVNCLSLWTILLITDFTYMSWRQTCLMIGACAIIIAYEFVLGVVRVQDYFQAHYCRLYGKQEDQRPPNIAAVMEGKLKEKLESLGIGCLCLAQGTTIPLESIAGVGGVVCLLLSVRLAHASLQHKLKARDNSEHIPVPSDSTSNNTADEPTLLLSDTQRKTSETNEKSANKGVDQSKTTNDVGVQVNEGGSENKLMRRSESVFDDDLSDIDEEAEKSDYSEKEEKRPMDSNQSQSEEETEDRKVMNFHRSHSVPTWNPSHTVDKVYTIGCFDLFHAGHVKLLERLRNIGTQVIVGVHDSRSIFKLKKRVPIDDTCKRMTNVKKYADVVYCIHGTDPTPYLRCIFDSNENATSLYVRGDDMPNFPARELTEKLMPVQFLPYTPTISSTKIRKEEFNASMFGPHVHHDDHTMFY